jgi:hypothetical protein
MDRLYKRFLIAGLLLACSPALGQQNDTQEVLQISITRQDLNVIGQALGQMPFNVAAPVIQRLNQELSAKAQKPSDPPKEPTKEK